MMIVWQQTQQQQEQSLFKMSTIELSFCYQQITMIIMQMIKYQNSINNISMMIKLNLNFQNSKIIPDFIPVYHCHWFVFFFCFFLLNILIPYSSIHCLTFICGRWFLISIIFVCIVFLLVNWFKHLLTHTHTLQTFRVEKIQQQ